MGTGVWMCLILLVFSACLPLAVVVVANPLRFIGVFCLASLFFNSRFLFVCVGRYVPGPVYIYISVYQPKPLCLSLPAYGISSQWQKNK